MSEITPETAAWQRGERRIFSPQLDKFLDQIQEGEAPNAGQFCAFCYTPVAVDTLRCTHCGQMVSERTPLRSVPRDVVEMHLRMRKRAARPVDLHAPYSRDDS